MTPTFLFPPKREAKITLCSLHVGFPSLAIAASDEPFPKKKQLRVKDHDIAGETDGEGGETGGERRCLHCATDKTPQWRTGPMGPKTLCNACGVRYKSGRLVPEYRPASSPTFVMARHSNSHRKVMELRRQKEVRDEHLLSQLRCENLLMDVRSNGDDFLIDKSDVEQTTIAIARVRQGFIQYDLSAQAVGSVRLALNLFISKITLCSLHVGFPSLAIAASDEPFPKKKQLRVKDHDIAGETDGEGGETGGERRCLHCATDKTPQWRTGPMGPKTLCNACGVRYKSGRLVPEYRPASSPTFVMARHSNSHRKVMELRRQKEVRDEHLLSQLRCENLLMDVRSNGDDFLIGNDNNHVAPDFRHLI
ncbi:hypothetical protein Bca52824_091890 [Brassica carinata]|uniref:GATA-type domain-containing protein n=1 Tax=Brassica carinata TaxID=52824 RepID=A0A8X7NTM3_BRACI|nr:hypothetical protein Bca52824_091890 [Brassica carinata]